MLGMSTRLEVDLREVDYRVPPNMIWLTPWVAIKQNITQLEDELARELLDAHILCGKKVRAIARRIDNDDVLFEVDDQDYQYAVVHLTWSGKQESSKEYPWTVLYSNFEDWVEKCMKLDH